MTSEFYTEVEWGVEIESTGNAKHKLIINLLNFSAKNPTLDETIAIELPSKFPFGEFRTIINDNNPLPAGYGYSKSLGKYVLDFVDIIELIDETIHENKVEVYFSEEGGIVHKMHDIHDFYIVTLSEFIPHLKASKINLKVKLPKITERWKKLLFHIQVALKKNRKGLYDIILPIGIKTDNIDLMKGEISHQVTEGRFPQTFEIYYRSIGEIQIASLIVGAVIGVILSIISTISVSFFS